MALFFYLSETTHLENSIRDEQTIALRKWAGLCSEAALTKNEIILIPYMAVLKREPKLAYSAYLDLAGKVLVHTDPDLIGRPWDPSWETGDLWVQSAPVMLRRQRAGRVLMAYKGDEVRSETRRLLARDMRRFGLIAASASAIALIVGLILAYGIARPLRIVAQGALLIGEGRLDHRIRIKRKDEIGILAASFNQMAKKLQELDELKNQFISTVSHDLRNPLSAVVMYGEWMLNDEKDQVLPRHREKIAVMVDNAKRLGIFVTNILDAAKIKAGKMEYHPRPLELSLVAKNALSLFSLVAQQKAVALSAEITPGLAPILADAERFDQVISNLVSNALKFTDRGGSIVLAAKPAAEKVRISVTDTGKGIPADKLPHIFEKFSQIDAAAQRAQGIKGTGLGLYISKKTIEDMGGQISAEPAPGRGARFVILMPVAMAP